MNEAIQPETAANISTAPTNHIRDLRATLDWLEAEGDLIVSDKEVDPNLEIIGLQKHFDGSCPLLFNNVKGKPDHRVVTNLFADTNVMNKMFGWPDDRTRTHKVAHALSRPVKPVEISQEDAPCQEIVIDSPKDVNDHVVAIRHTEHEPELTVGSGIRCVSGEYFGGGTDTGYNRMNFRWGNVGTYQVAPGSHMWQVLQKHYDDDKPVPITMCFGTPVACTLMAGAAYDYVILPHGCDELGVAGAIQGSPIRLVKARTVDAMAMADAEIVFEGYINPRDRRYETAEAEEHDVQGRYHFHPEWAGYMGKSYKAATFHVTAVTMRKPDKKPINFVLSPHTMDEHNIDTTIREGAMFELCNRIQPGIIQDVVIPYAMTDWGGAMIQIKKGNKVNEGWQRNFLAALCSTSQGLRVAIALSEDADLYDMDDVMWNITTRVNPITDIFHPVPGGRGQTFMPSERMSAGDKEWKASNTRFEGGLCIDATVPFGFENDFLRPQYPIDKVKPEDFFDEGQIKNARDRMKGWAVSLAKSGW